jgi:phosphoribosylformylglycinamidine synthase I
VIRAGVIRFPGSNCDQDTLRALQNQNGISASFHWHEDELKVGQYDLIVIPGGFSFGDYLRAGAIAKQSPAIMGLSDAIEAGAHCLGLCNGFQILLEARLLPGYLTVNSHLKFVSRVVELKVSGEAFPWFCPRDHGKILRFPVAHKFGNYQIQKIDVSEVKPALTYLEDINGSHQNIAGVYRKHGKGSILGMMPHPERASFEDLKLMDGQLLWKNAVENLK